MNRTTHPIEREEVMAWLDGELDVARAAFVEAHVGECNECRALADELRAVSVRMAEWQVERAPAPLTTRVEAAAREAAAPASKPRKWLLPTWAWQLATVLGVLVIAVALFTPNLLRSKKITGYYSVSEGEFDQAMRAPQSAQGGGGGGRGDVSPGVFGTEKLQTPNQERLGPMIIRTASLTIVTKDFENTRAAVEQVVRKHGGYIAQLSASRPNEGAKGLTATVRVPAEKLDATLAELKTLGRVENETVSGEEVRQQYVDLMARLANARHTEQRLVEVLRTRTGKVSEVLEVEQEIARVREEIERMDAQRKTLEKQVQFATVSLRISEEYRAQLAPPRPSVTTQMWNAAVSGYESVTESLLGLALFLLSYGPPLLFWGAVLFWPARYAWRRIRAEVQA